MLAKICAFLAIILVLLSSVPVAEGKPAWATYMLALAGLLLFLYKEIGSGFKP